MPVNPKTDPRCFVLIHPLPIPTQQGLRVQARSSTIYNCWDYTREQVFLENYRRRIKQLTQQGYFTPNWKPYQDFADPLYLEPKKVTLYGLGQLPLVGRLYGIIHYIISPGTGVASVDGSIAPLSQQGTSGHCNSL